ncbi:MAG: TonB-dependent receptor [Gammaproteobacteria bacterium]|nr:TonB-dependent receptor [Gammaproteobacteria bacterium]
MPSIFIKTLLLSLTSLISVNIFAESLLQPVVITASRHSESLDDTLASTTVISRDDIEASNSSTLEELLNTVSGLDVRTSGSYGKATSIFMRGTGSSHILTMIDGIKIYSATGGSTAFQHIPLSQIERIEIVRGPRSGLYGSEAIGGVIQIFTRKSYDKAQNTLHLEAGSNNTSELTAGSSGQHGKLSYSLFVSQFNTDGIDSIEHATANDDDAYDNTSISSNLSYSINKSLTLDVSLLNAQGTTLYDNCYNASFATSDDCSADIEQQSISTTMIFAPEGIWDSSLQIGSSKDFSDNFWESAANNTYETKHKSVTFQNNFQLTENHLLIAGIDNTVDEVEATPYVTFDNTRDNQGVYLSWNAQLDAFSVSTSIRSDDNEQFGTHSTGSLSSGYEFKNKMKVFVSYGTAFKAPTFNELYYPFYGSADLVPEESESFEMGIKQKRNKLNWGLSYYNTTIDNLIAYDSALFTANNISKAEIEGFEASISADISNWKMNLSSSYVEPINKDDSNFGNILPARVQESTNLSVSRQFSKTNFSVSVLNQGKRFNDASNSTKVDGYTTVDLKLGYKLTKALKIEAKVNNAFDEDYVINASSSTIYNTTGRTVFISLNYKM